MNTACSASLCALDAAVLGVHGGRCTQAMAFGIKLMLMPASFLIHAAATVMSITGRSRTFDANADGMGLGEGCGSVRIALSSSVGKERVSLLGSFVGHGGRAASLTAPSGPA